jgi:hypothetical protein
MNNLKIGQKLYTVDKIITRKIIKGKKFYLIKWKGYPLEYCSWEPKYHLTNIIEEVKFFDDNFPLSIERKEYKQFMRLFQNYQKKKKLNKNERNETKKPKSNIIIIGLDELIVMDRNEEQNEKDNELCIISENESQTIVKINLEEEKEIKEEATSVEKECNSTEGAKLIEPIIIW